METELKLFYFTFGSNCGTYSHKCQPVYAQDWICARLEIIEHHGKKWAFQYTQEEWERLKNDPDRLFPLEDELDPIVSTYTQEGCNYGSI